MHGTLVDISPLLQAAVTLGAGCLAGCAPLATAWVGRLLHMQNQANLQAQLNIAIRAGGGLAYHLLATEAARPCDVAVRNAAVATAVRDVMAALPSTTTNLHLSTTHLHALVAGELGRLLAIDPSVSVSGAGATKAVS